MKPASRFNIRVYGILINEGQILLNKEWYTDRWVVKFPGGGLELGEGIKDCLIREWKEELNLDIEVQQHFYTTDFFQASAFDTSQVISIYYVVSVADLPNEIVNIEANEESFWMPLNEVNTSTFTLPIDKVVGAMLQEKFKE